MPLNVPITEDMVRGLAPDDATWAKAAELVDSDRFVNPGVSADGTWLLAQNAASDRCFGFALALSASPENALGRLALSVTDGGTEGSLTLASFFDRLHTRRPFDGLIAPSRRLTRASPTRSRSTP